MFLFCFLVAKSWAEVVKLGVARPQSKTVKKSVRKARSVKKITKSPKVFFFFSYLYFLFGLGVFLHNHKSACRYFAIEAGCLRAFSMILNGC